jgi:hypothetical protein
MAITQAACTSFKSELLEKFHDLGSGGDAIKIALFTSAATLDETTTVYAAANEAAGAGYVAGGNTLAGQVVTTSGSTAYVDFTDSTWAASSITARGALIYNSTAANRAIIVLDFGVDKTSSASNFVITFPAADANNAIIRLT